MTSTAGELEKDESEENQSCPLDRRASLLTESPDSSDVESSDGEDDEASLRSMISGVPGMDDTSVRTYVKRLKLFSDSESDYSEAESEPTVWDGADASDDSSAPGYYAPSDDSSDDEKNASTVNVVIPGEARSVKLTPAKKPKFIETTSKESSVKSPKKKISLIDKTPTRMFHILHSEKFERHTFQAAPPNLTFPLELPPESGEVINCNPVFGPELAPLNVLAARKIINLTLKSIVNLKKAGRILDKDDKSLAKMGVGAIDKILRSSLGKDAKKPDLLSEQLSFEGMSGDASSERQRLLNLLKTISNLDHCSSSWPMRSLAVEYTKQGVVHRDVMEEEREFWEMWVRRYTETAIIEHEYFQNLPLLVLLLQLLIGNGRVGSIAFEKGPHLIPTSFIEVLCRLRLKNLFYVTHLWLDGYKFDRARLFYTFMQICSSPELLSLRCRVRRKNEFLALSVFAYSVKELTLVGKSGSMKSKKIKKYLMRVNDDNSSDSGRESSVGQREGMVALRTVHLYDESCKDRSRILLRWAAKCPRIRHVFSGGHPVCMIKSKKNNYKYNIRELRLGSLAMEAFRKRSEYKRYRNLRELSFSDSNIWTRRHFKIFKALIMKLSTRLTGIHWTIEGRYSVNKISEILNTYLGVSGCLKNLTLRMLKGFNITDAIYVLKFFANSLTKLTLVGPPEVAYVFTEKNKKLFNCTFPRLQNLTVRVTQEGDAKNLSFFIRSLLLRSNNLKTLELHLSDKNMAEVSFYLPLYSLEHIETVILRKISSNDEEPQNWVTALVRSLPALKTLVILDKDLELIQHLRAWRMAVHNVSVMAPRHYPEF